MPKAEKKARKEARRACAQFISNFDDGKELFCKFVEQLDRSGKRMLIKAIKKGNIRELLGLDEKGVVDGKND